MATVAYCILLTVTVDHAHTARYLFVPLHNAKEVDKEFPLDETNDPHVSKLTGIF
jgi:hypothetical protein